MPNRKRTRREFLATGATTAAIVTSIQPARGAVFTTDERAALAAAMDEIIPAADGMPAASQVGGVDYLERVVPSVEGLLDQFGRDWPRWKRKAANRPASPLRSYREPAAWKF